MKLAICLLLGLTSAWAQEDILRIENWRVQPGDDPRWAAPDFDDSSWRTSSWPRRYTSNQEFFAGTRWYRATIAVPSQFAQQTLAIGLSPLDEVFEVFVEGVRVGRYGEWDSAPVGRFPRHLTFRIPEGIVHGPSLHIALRRWTGRTRTNYNVLVFNGAILQLHAPELGRASLIASREEYHASSSALGYIFNSVASGLAVIVGLVSLGLFLSQRNRRENLWLGLTLLCMGLPSLAGTWLASGDGPLRSPLAAILVAFGILVNGLTCLFLASICPRLQKLLYLAAAVVAVDALLGLPNYSAQISFAIFEQYRSENLGPVSIAMFATLATIAILYWERRGTHSTLLACSLVILPMAHFWSTKLAFWLGLEAYRFPLIGGFAIDPRNVAHVLFALLAVAGLYLRLRQEQTRQAVLDRDLSAARLIQESLVDSGIAAPGFAIDTAYLPANEVGGDFYQTIPAADGSLLVVAGDVSGKGMPASLLVAATIGALGDLASRHPADVLAHLNRALHGKTRGGFVTCCCALFHRNGRVDLANAGHLAPYMSGREIDVEGGLPLGLSPDAEYAETAIHTDGTLTFVSDGVVEAANAKGELFGFDRTSAISTRPAKEIAAAAQSWGQNDDITVLTVRRLACA